MGHTNVKILSNYGHIILYCNVVIALKNGRICRENNKYVPDENFVAILAFAEGLPISATLS